MKPKIDPWLALVLTSMGLDELRKEATNPANTPAERQAMIAELKKRGAQ